MSFKNWAIRSTVHGSQNMQHRYLFQPLPGILARMWCYVFEEGRKAWFQENIPPIWLVRSWQPNKSWSLTTWTSRLFINLSMLVTEAPQVSRSEDGTAALCLRHRRCVLKSSTSRNTGSESVGEVRMNLNSIIYVGGKDLKQLSHHELMPLAAYPRCWFM